jgi:hypothetical protein
MTCTGFRGGKTQVSTRWSGTRQGGGRGSHRARLNYWHPSSTASLTSPIWYRGGTVVAAARASLEHIKRKLINWKCLKYQRRSRTWWPSTSYKNKSRSSSAMSREVNHLWSQLRPYISPQMHWSHHLISNMRALVYLLPSSSFSKKSRPNRRSNQ